MTWLIVYAKTVDMADDRKNAIITPLQKQNVNQRECKTTEGLIYQVLNSDQKHVRHDCEKHFWQI